MVWHGMAWQGKARQGKARQGKARQDKARQDKTRQDKAIEDIRTYLAAPISSPLALAEATNGVGTVAKKPNT